MLSSRIIFAEKVEFAKAKLSVPDLKRFYCWYVTSRCDLYLWHL